MRIIIQENGEKKRRICLPSGLVLNRLSAGILAAGFKGKNVNISGRQLSILFRQIKAYKATHPEWKLVEVRSSNGDHVEIVL